MLRLYFLTIFFSCNCYLFEKTFPKDTLDDVVKPINDGIIPLYWDWRDLNKVSPVKNQGSCNACWAFSAVANIESHLLIYKNQSEQLSEQFLIDCDGRRIGCKSASILNTFSVIVDKLGGVLRKRDYSSYSGQVADCRWNGKPAPIPVIGYRRVKSDEIEMIEFLYRYGPLSAGINPDSMVKYSGGIDEPSDELCPPDDMRHAVLIVGYNFYVNPKNGKVLPYWIIKNSWGTQWGDRGFYYLVLGRNACGIANDVSFSFVD